MQEKPRNVSTVIMLIAIVILIFMNINLRSRLTNLEHGINNIQMNQVNELRSLQWTISEQIDSIEAQITQLSRISFDETLNVLNYNGDTLSANVEIGFNLKEFGADDEVSVSARGIDGQVFTATANRSDAGRFTAAMSLPIQDNFVVTFTTRGTTVSSGNLMELNLADRLCDRFIFYLDIGISTTHATHGNRASSVMTFAPYLVNAAEGNDLLAIRDVSIVALSNGRAVQEWDLLPYLQADDVSQFIKTSELWEWDRFQFTESDVEEDAITAIKLVVYDNLGIRYEQMEPMPLFHIRASGAAATWGGSAVAFSEFPNRVIRYGDESWHFIHMVVTD